MRSGNPRSPENDRKRRTMPRVIMSHGAIRETSSQIAADALHEGGRPSGEDEIFSSALLSRVNEYYLDVPNDDARERGNQADKRCPSRGLWPDTAMKPTAGG